MQQIYENNKSFSRKIANTLDWNGTTIDTSLDMSNSFHLRSQSTNKHNFFNSVYSNITNTNNLPSHRYNNSNTDEDKIKDITHQVHSARDISKKDFMSLKYNREEEEEKNKKMKLNLIKNKDKKRSVSNNRIKQELNNTFD